MFSGIKTYNGAIGVNQDSLPARNLVEILSDKNFLTGFVTSASVTDATPAAFYAHIPDRSMQYDIANSLLQSEIDFFAGGGMQYFIRTDGIDEFKNNKIIVTNSELHKIKTPEAGMRYGFLLAMDGLPSMLDARGNFLPDATSIALDFLSGKESGFILMVEGAQIDWAGHSNNAGYLIAEMTDFEKTVRVAYDFAKKDGHTLVIVTADHETGGFTLGASGDRQYGNDYATIDPNFSTVSHSAALVPLLAYGPGSENFCGIFQNTEIFNKIRTAMGR
jgi:alkaline phosphatase